MDYTEMTWSSWGPVLPRFKDLLRRDGEPPLAQPYEAVEALRADDSVKVSFPRLTEDLPLVLFPGQRDWRSLPDERLLEYLGWKLTSEDEQYIVRLLLSTEQSDLKELVRYLVDQRLPEWQQTDPEDADGADGAPAEAAPPAREIIEPYGVGFMKAVDGKWRFGSSRDARTWYATYAEMLAQEVPAATATTNATAEAEPEPLPDVKALAAQWDELTARMVRATLDRLVTEDAAVAAADPDERNRMFVDAVMAQAAAGTEAVR
jgi:hypothetical protein